MKTLSSIGWVVLLGVLMATLLWIAASVIEIDVKHHDSPTYSAANFFEVMDTLRGK